MELRDVGDVLRDLVASAVTADDEVFGEDLWSVVRSCSTDQPHPGNAIGASMAENARMSQLPENVAHTNSAFDTNNYVRERLVETRRRHKLGKSLILTVDRDSIWAT